MDMQKSTVEKQEDFIKKNEENGYNVISKVLPFAGKKVMKKSKRPFKSGEKVNTVANVCSDIYLKRLCFTFEEDDSHVECHRCILSE